jgi:hypothetical protein
MDSLTTDQEIRLFNDITAYAESLWNKTAGMVASTTDPKLFSAMLYTRLWSHHRGFTTLWEDGHGLEAAIILRAGIEVAICLAANAALKDEFINLMRQDAAWTFERQKNAHRHDGEIDGVRNNERVVNDLKQGLPPGVKPAKLNWQKLAEQGKVDGLYGEYSLLSGMSSHVTGASVLAALTPTDDEDGELRRVRAFQRRRHLIMMGGATTIGATRHALMLDEHGAVETGLRLFDRLGAVTGAWQEC